MIYKADLHIHSCLSPCGSLDMSPRAIVSRAAEIGLNCIALTDHNSALNCAATARLCEREGILFFPGLEVTTAEEAHIVCLFDDVGAAEELGRMIYEKLPPVKYNSEKFGDQVYVNEDDDVEGFVEDKYLVTACGYTIDELRVVVAKLGGLFIAAHVDKPHFSVVSQLGILSGEFSAAEISRAGAMRGGIPISAAMDEPHEGYGLPPTATDGLRNLIGGYAATTASDSHYLHTIGSAYTEFEPNGEKGFACLKRALHNKQTRLVIFDSAFRAPIFAAPQQRG